MDFLPIEMWTKILRDIKEPSDICSLNLTSRFFYQLVRKHLEKISVSTLEIWSPWFDILAPFTRLKIFKGSFLLESPDAISQFQRNHPFLETPNFFLADTFHDRAFDLGKFYHNIGIYYQGLPPNWREFHLLYSLKSCIPRTFISISHLHTQKNIGFTFCKHAISDPLSWDGFFFLMEILIPNMVSISIPNLINTDFAHRFFDVLRKAPLQNVIIKNDNHLSYFISYLKDSRLLRFTYRPKKYDDDPQTYLPLISSLTLLSKPYDHPIQLLFGCKIPFLLDVLKVFPQCRKIGVFLDYDSDDSRTTMSHVLNAYPDLQMEIYIGVMDSINSLGKWAIETHPLRIERYRTFLTVYEDY